MKYRRLVERFRTLWMIIHRNFICFDQCLWVTVFISSIIFCMNFSEIISAMIYRRMSWAVEALQRTYHGNYVHRHNCFVTGLIIILICLALHICKAWTLVSVRPRPEPRRALTAYPFILIEAIDTYQRLSEYWAKLSGEYTLAFALFHNELQRSLH